MTPDGRSTGSEAADPRADLSGDELRRATVADAAAIAGVEGRAWWHAYRGFIDEQRLLERDLADRTRDWEGFLDPARGTEDWVLEVAGRVAGYASIAPARDEDVAPGTGELLALYVDPPAQGAGVGSRLLDHVHGRLAALGHDEAILWVFRENGLARGFYAQRGWVLDPAASDNAACERWAPAVRLRRGPMAPSARDDGEGLGRPT